MLLVFGLLMMLENAGPLPHKVALVAGVDGPFVHRPFVVSQAALHRGLVVALVAGEGDETVLGHLVDLGAGLADPVQFWIQICNGSGKSKFHFLDEDPILTS